MRGFFFALVMATLLWGILEGRSSLAVETPALTKTASSIAGFIGSLLKACNGICQTWDRRHGCVEDRDCVLCVNDLREVFYYLNEEAISSLCGGQHQ